MPPDDPLRSGPLALIETRQGGVRLTAVDPRAVSAGLRPDMTLADARALCPELQTLPADPAADERALTRLADWCGRYSPWSAPDGCDGIILETTGCDHLLGGEADMMTDMIRRLRLAGIRTQAGLAGTPGAAWGWARFRDQQNSNAIIPDGQVMAHFAALPLMALRLSQDVATEFAGLGIREVRQLYRLPRSSLARRFGGVSLKRLDQVLGRMAEPVSPIGEVSEFRVRRLFPEPVGTGDNIAAALDELLEQLTGWLEKERLGARWLIVSCYRADGGVARIESGCARPSRDVAHWRRLLAEKIDDINPGFGIDAMALSAPRTDRLVGEQPGLSTGPDNQGAVTGLVDRLANRLGSENVLRQGAMNAFRPEASFVMTPPYARNAGEQDAWPTGPPRPLRLFPEPEPIDVRTIAGRRSRGAQPDWFRWRRVARRIIRMEGPERITPDWWRMEPQARSHLHGVRDYFRAEDASGRRFWLYRMFAEEMAEGGPDTGSDTGSGIADPSDAGVVQQTLPFMLTERWFIHGLF